MVLCFSTFVHPRAVRKPHREKSLFYEWIIRLSFAMIGYEWITLLRIKLLHKEVRSKRSTCASVGMNRVCVESESAAFSHHVFTNLWMNSLIRGTIAGCVVSLRQDLTTRGPKTWELFWWPLTCPDQNPFSINLLRLYICFRVLRRRKNRIPYKSKKHGTLLIKTLPMAQGRGSANSETPTFGLQAFRYCYCQFQSSFSFIIMYFTWVPSFLQHSLFIYHFISLR